MDKTRTACKDAQTQLGSSQSEEQDAEAFLVEAEKRWDVIDVADSDDEAQSQGARVGLF